LGFFRDVIGDEVVRGEDERPNLRFGKALMPVIEVFAHGPWSMVPDQWSLIQGRWSMRREAGERSAMV
jgi:hypothetical protein